MENRYETGPKYYEMKGNMKTPVLVVVLVVTNPIWLALFGRGVEDPNWGRRPIDQHTIATTIHELAATIADAETRRQIQNSAARLMVNTVQDMIKESQSADECT
jgi:hypothetical protein